MVNITITPAAWHACGSLKAEGHAGHGPEGADLVCAAVTVLIEGLASNLKEIFGLNIKREVKPGFIYMRWTRASGSDCIKEANKAAWHFYVALKELGEAYPDAVRVRWNRQEYFKGRGKRNETQRRDHRSDKPASE